MAKPPSSTLDKTALPTVLAYPEVFHLDQVPEVVGQFCYQVKGYALTGIAIVLRLDASGTYIRIGDWDGNAVSEEMKRYQVRFMKEYAHLFIHLMRIAKIAQVELYVSCDKDSMILVDVRTALDRMAGPGYVKDIFGKMMPSQETIGEPVTITKEIVAALKKDKNHVILKPTLFKTFMRGITLHALYVRNWK